jgi:peptidoglycan/xylan/chitin deacetylase (PgdA/CDA1 family)
MRIPGWKTFQQSARWLRSRFSSGALILGYHRVAEPSRDPFGMCVSPAHFAEHLEVLRQFTFPVSLSHVVGHAQSGQLPRRAVVITFDDGYRDNLDAARPLLEEYEVPATIFVATGCLGAAFWWDELEALVYAPESLPETLSFSVGKSSFQWHAERDSRLPLLHALYGWLLSLDVGARNTVLAQMRMWTNAPLGSLLMTPQEVRTITECDLLEIGAHTVSHPVLDKLPLVEQQREIRESKAYLETLLEKQIKGFSYPNGAFSRFTRDMVRDAGFAYSCTSVSDVMGTTSDLWALPRFWIPNWDGDRFYRWLRRWLR